MKTKKEPIFVAQKDADDASREAAIAETAWRSSAKARQPKAWAASVATIEDGVVRVSAASVIWYDFFSQREVGGRWPHLDVYLLAWHKDMDADPAAVVDALVACGYPRYFAYERMQVKTRPTAMPPVAAQKKQVAK